MSLSSSLFGTSFAVPALQACPSPSRRTCVRSVASASTESHPSRRSAALGGLLALGAAISIKTDPAEAAYGEAAKIFGKVTDTSGFIPFAGEGYALLLPSKWNPSKEKDFPNTVLRWEDNFDALSHVVVTKTSTDKSSIDAVGSQDAFLKQIGYYIGEQVFAGETISEGGFEKDKVSNAVLLEQDAVKDKNGRSYYKYSLLVRAADGNEGGRHVLLTATVGSGYLYVAKVQCGDKRWFKGADKQAMTVSDSFTVA